jgi:hypothetical protein
VIAAVGVAACVGCGAAVNEFTDGTRTILRDRSLVWSPEHLCADPEKREVVLLDKPTGCWACGHPNAAMTTWGRLVDFPVDSIWSDGWVGPLYAHVCVRVPQGSRKPVWEAFGA